jgi:hypothetical protein
MTNILKLTVLFTFLVSCGACTGDENSGTGTNEPSIVYPVYEDVLDYDLDQTTATIIEYKTDNTVKITGSGAAAVNTITTITAAGTYILSGVTADGRIIVDSKDANSIKIVLNGIDITSKTSSAIYVKSAQKVIFKLADGAINKLTDATNYIFDDVTTQEPSGAIYSKEDLTFYGTGSLDVVGNFQDGIVSKDGIVIKSGNISVTAKDDAIRGKNYIVIRDGNLNLTATQDGLKSSGTPEEGLGFVIIDNGNINISAGDDGIHGEYYITINNGTTNIKFARSDRSKENYGQWRQCICQCQK